MENLLRNIKNAVEEDDFNKKYVILGETHTENDIMDLLYGVKASVPGILFDLYYFNIDGHRLINKYQSIVQD